MSSSTKDKATPHTNPISINNNGKTNPQPPSETDQKSQVSLNTSLPAKPLSSTSSSSSSSNGSTKSHKIEGKNKKSLHHKQQQNQASMNQQGANQQSQEQTSQSSKQANTSNRRSHQKNGPNGSNKLPGTKSGTFEPVNICSTLEDFSKRAQDLKADINKALEKQTIHQNTDQPIEVVKLKENILKLSGLDAQKDEGVEKSSDTTSVITEHENDESLTTNLGPQEDEPSQQKHDPIDTINDNRPADVCPTTNVTKSSTNPGHLSKSIVSDVKSSQEDENHNNCNIKSSSCQKETNDEPTDYEAGVNAAGYKSDTNLFQALDNLKIDDRAATKDCLVRTINKPASKKQKTAPQLDTDSATTTQNDQSNNQTISDEFEPLNAKLDPDSKFVALKSSLQKHFAGTPHLLEPVCRKLVNMSEQNGQLMKNCERYQSENQKLTLVKQKLENLCRELQKSNNAIRIESLDLIKVEQGKAKEQTTKIQSTLSGVIKLFDENQQRNMSLRQENQELQTKLKSLLDHCDNWEKSVEAALRQRDIENRLIKTELAKANLLKNEEKEKFLGEKQELLQILSMMQEQQHRIEGQEAKLRSDLSSYASKYDECQAVISKGMNKFQTESKKMLKQIERSKQDYKLLLSKYESSNKRMAQLLEEKQYWDRAMNLANKKIETLEKLCRALRERKQEGKNESLAGSNANSKSSKANKSGISSRVSIDKAEIKKVVVIEGALNSDINRESSPSKEGHKTIENDNESASVSVSNDDDSHVQILSQNGSIRTNDQTHVDDAHNESCIDGLDGNGSGEGDLDELKKVVVSAEAIERVAIGQLE